MRTYKLNITITDSELSALLLALDGARNDWYAELDLLKADRKARKISKRNARDCRRLYRQAIVDCESLDSKVYVAIPHNA